MDTKMVFHEELKKKMDAYAHLIYRLTKRFPKDEMYGVTSQLRRSALSVILNYIEGYARASTKVHRNFLETAYASLKESKYLLHFSHIEGYMRVEDYRQALECAEEIGRMLWGVLRNMKRRK